MTKSEEVKAEIAELSLEEWQNSLNKAREAFKRSAERNFPNKWFATEVCASVYAQLFIADITQPFALILMGSPSSKKTTVLKFYSKLDYSYRSDRFTPKSFVSHSATVSREGLADIDLLPRLKEKCFITPELAPIFGAKDDELLENISILTSVLDGEGYTSDSGVHGQRGYTEPIMFVWLGAVVDIPRRLWKMLGNLGSKLYFLRLPSEATDEEKDIETLQNDSYMNKLNECRSYAKEYTKLVMSYPISGPNYIHIESSKRCVKWDKNKDPKEVVRVIIRVARLLTHLRAAATVWETAGTGGSEYAFSTPIIENPDRAEHALYNLARGHALSCGRTQISYEDLPVVISVALSSASRERTALFEMLLEKDGLCTTTDFTNKLGCSETTASKTMKELEIIGLVSSEVVESKTKPKNALKLKPEFDWFLTQEFNALRQGIVRLDNLEKIPMSTIEVNNSNRANLLIGEISKLSSIIQPWTLQNKEIDPLYSFIPYGTE